jgi:predicted membrane protein
MNRSAVGLILILLGSAFLLHNLGWIPNVSRYIFSWPNFLFLIAAGLLISGKPKPALVFVLIGGFFFAQRHFYIDTQLFWPIVLIILGLAFILRKSSSSSSSSENRMEETSIFSGSEKTYSSPAFEGGKVTTIFGGSELDLRNATPTAGATIDVFTLFGGAELKIPNHWNVVLDATPILGGVSDERDKSVAKDGPTIRITGFVMFGGVGIKA